MRTNTKTAGTTKSPTGTVKMAGTTKTAGTAKRPPGTVNAAGAAKRQTGKKPRNAHAIQLEIQAAELFHDLAREVAEILWARFQIECLRASLEDAKIVTHITDLSSLPSPHAEATPEEVVQAVTRAVAGELPGAEIQWRIYQGVPEGRDRALWIEN
jgi:hypothetical protein